jgi:zinc protease
MYRRTLWFLPWRAVFALAALALLLLAPPAAAVQIQRVMADGIEAWLVEDHSNPIIALGFAFSSGGAAYDPADKPGVARMVSALLDEGAGDLDSQAYQRKLEDLAIRLRFDASLDTFSGSMETLTANRHEAFNLVRLALTQPRFDAEPVERLRSQLQASLREQAEDPDAEAGRKMWALLFPNHPYGRPVDGTLESTARIDRSDLTRFAERRLARDGMAIGVVGDITAAELAPMLRATFGSLPARAPQETIAAVVPNATGGVVVTSMNVPQSAVVFAQPGLKRDDPQFYALTVLNQILGGQGLTSRLFEEVRERRGLVYSIYTGLVPLDHSALIIGGAGTRNDRVAEMLDLVRAEWHRLESSGVTPAELVDAKTYLIGSYPLRFAGSGRLAGLLVAVQLDKLGIDYIDRRPGLIEAVTLQDVNALAREVLDSSKLSFVIVGAPDMGRSRSP